jgi:phospholipase/carboxylesterase
MLYIHKFIKQSARTFVLLHGTGGDENDLISLAESIDNTASILSLRGNVLENGMNRFFERYANGSFNTEDIKQRSKDLKDFLEESSAEYKFNLDDSIILGFSNGANIAVALLLLYPNVINNAILFRPTLPLEVSNNINLGDSRIFIASGLTDPYAPSEKVSKLTEILSSAGADIHKFEFPGGHGLTQQDILKAKEWYDIKFKV